MSEFSLEVVNMDVLIEVFYANGLFHQRFICCGWLCRHTLGQCWYLSILSNN